MKRALAGAALVALACVAPALAEAPKAGQTVDEIALVVNRSVIFRPAEDGRFEILKVYENDRTVQLPRVAGEVAVAMSFNNEGGTILEFNNGMPYSFDYDLKFASADGARVDPRFPVCTVGSERVGVEHWPQPYPGVVISRFRKAETFSC